jgi:putative ABC transport system ATP-binding protein
MILSVDHIVKTFDTKGRQLTVVDDVSFGIQQGENVAIVGPSGSGKTTLLGLCAGLDTPTSGRITLAGKDITQLDEDEKAAIRNEHVGFIFQNFQLLPTLTALENVMIPLELQGKTAGAKERAVDLLTRVGLGDRLTHYPSQLSGGEQQRVSLARAFSNNPKVLFADEPTGNLDNETGQMVEDLLLELNREQGTTLIIVTHDVDLANRADRVLSIKGGRLITDIKKQTASL